MNIFLNRNIFIFFNSKFSTTKNNSKQKWKTTPWTIAWEENCPTKTEKRNPPPLGNKESLIPGSTLIEVRRFFRPGSLRQFREILPQKNLYKKRPPGEGNNSSEKNEPKFLLLWNFFPLKAEKSATFSTLFRTLPLLDSFRRRIFTEKKCVIIEGPHGRHTTEKKSCAAIDEWVTGENVEEFFPPPLKFWSNLK